MAGTPGASAPRWPGFRRADLLNTGTPRPPPRYAAHRSLPVYPFRPGRTPHPRTDPAGHSYGAPEPICEPLTAANWRTHDAWLFGIDLFNRSFWWEAHEEWEAAWRASSEGSTRQLLQGLIQLGAALLKWEAGNARGRGGLWRRARVHLEAVPTDRGCVMGLDLRTLLLHLDRVFVDVDAPQAPSPAELPSPPVVHLRLAAR